MELHTLAFPAVVGQYVGGTRGVDARRRRRIGKNSQKKERPEFERGEQPELQKSEENEE
jgi:hypothetical protein